jgi:hypothetical protein
MNKKSSNLDNLIISEWRELGFYYDINEDDNVNEWRFFGSKIGLQKFVTLLTKYVNDPRNNSLSEHDHYGPYGYLKIMTWDKPEITNDYFAGTIEDLTRMRDIISEKISKTNSGQTFNIDTEYGLENTASARFFIMPDDFDPYSIEEQLILDNRKSRTKNEK